MSMILSITSMLIIIIIGFTYSLYAKPRKNVVLETTLADQFIERTEVQTVRKRYKHRILFISGILLVFSLPMLLIPYDSIQFILFTLILLLSFILFHSNLIGFIKQMQQLKQQHNWFVGEQKEIVRRADTKLSLTKNQKIIRLPWILLPIVGQSLLTIMLFFTKMDISFKWINLFLLLINVLFLFIYRVLTHLPFAIYTSDSHINQLMNDSQRRTWSVLLVVTEWFMLLVFLFPLASYLTNNLLETISFALLLVGTFAFPIFIISYLLLAQKKQEKIYQSAEKYYYDDVDYYWRYGVYYNPKDPRFWINNRIGTQITMNLGHRSAQLIEIGIAIVVSVILISVTVPIWKADFLTDYFDLSIKQGQVAFDAPFAEKTSLDINEIESVSLLTEVPKSVRINGGGTTNYATGKFQLTETNEIVYFYLYLPAKKYIEIKTNDKLYFVSNKTGKETEEIYQELEKLVNQ